MRPAYTKEELLDLWRRIFPRGYTVPLEEEAEGRGFDVIAAQAAIFERASQAIETNHQAYFLKPHSIQTSDPASGGQKATGTVLIERAPPLAGDLTLVAGIELLVVQRSPEGIEVEGPTFVVAEDVTLSAGDSTPVQVSIEALREGYQGNVPPNRITRFAERGGALVEGASVISANQIEDTGQPDRFVESMVGQYVEIVTGVNASAIRRQILSVTRSATSIVELDGPALTFPDLVNVRVLDFSELGLTITQPEATSNGKNAFLDAIGADRSVGRVALETDEPYRDRLCELDDTVAPAAILRATGRILSPLGIKFRIKETRDPSGLGGFVLDRDAFDFGSLTDGRLLLSAGCGDVRYFIVCVQGPDSTQYGVPYDAVDPPTPNAWDLMPFDAGAVPPVEYTAALLALYAELFRIRAGGVCFDIVLDPSL